MASSITVAVRVRPPTERERALLMPSQSSSAGVCGDNCLTSTPTQPTRSLSSHRSLRPIIRVLDERVLIFDPPESNPLQQAQRQILARLGGGRKVKDMRFCFDRVFEESASQEDVYEGSAKDLVAGVLDGFNATAFAYGATGCGKTHTITGTPEAPGIVYMLMKDLFGRIDSQADEMSAEISISYLEIYNETIRDLLNPNAPMLNLREANSSVSVPGLSTKTPDSATDVITLISAGNVHRTVHGTDANAVSSRSHAVLSVNVRRKPKTAAMTDDWTVATLSVIDLAGSERAAVTKNKGDRLLEGANINKSLLALGNCINALCDPKAKDGHVPYRNSKLTRLLKHSLGGNCRTLMIVCVAPTSAHYDETHNTLQYANRAKEIKTKAIRNIISVDRHVSQYVQMIYELRQEIEGHKNSEAAREKRMKEAANRHRQETDSAVLKGRKHWQDYMLTARSAHEAKGRLDGLNQFQLVLRTWHEAMTCGQDTREEFKQWVGREIQPINSNLEHERQLARQTVEQGSVAQSMFDACVSSLGRTVERNSGAEGKSIFDREVQGWAREVGEIILDHAQRQGKAETLARTVSQTAGWLTQLGARFFTEPSLEQYRARFTQATEAAFQCLACADSVGPAPSLAQASSSATSLCKHSPNGFNHTSAFQHSRSIDKSVGSFSEETSLIARPSKTRRPSTATSPSKLASTYFAKRASPRKQVRFPSRNPTHQTTQHAGILKTRPTSSSSFSSGPSLPLSTNGNQPSQQPNVSKSAGVRWRDVESDGDERLESFDQTMTSLESSAMEDSMFSNQSSQLLHVPSLSVGHHGAAHESTSNLNPSTSPLTTILAPTEKKRSPVKMNQEAEHSTTAKLMESTSFTTGFKVGTNGSSSNHAGRSNRMKAGYLQGQEGEQEQLVRSQPPITLPSSFSFGRVPFRDTLNTSNNGSGQLPLVRRRSSLVGPIRKSSHLKGSLRRQSSTGFYKRTPVGTSTSSATSASTGVGLTGVAGRTRLAGRHSLVPMIMNRRSMAIDKADHNGNSNGNSSTHRFAGGGGGFGRVPFLGGGGAPASHHHQQQQQHQLGALDFGSGNLSLSPRKLMRSNNTTGSTTTTTTITTGGGGTGGSSAKICAVGGGASGGVGQISRIRKVSTRKSIAFGGGFSASSAPSGFSSSSAPSLVPVPVSASATGGSAATLYPRRTASSSSSSTATATSS